MRIISKKIITDFCEIHPQAKRPLQAWYADTKQAKWQGPHEIKSIYKNASIVSSNRVVFNIKGNDYRVVVAINYKFGIVYIRFIGTHKAYDKIDATKI